jgi:cytochrome c5
MSSNTSGKFFFGSITTFIIVFGVILTILSTISSCTKKVVEPESMDAAAVEERIKPVAEVNIGEAPAVVAPVVEEEAPASAGGAGEKIVNQVCAVCHASGMMSSPKLGSAADWAPRIEKGIDELYNSALHGFNMMPARGGNPSLSDDDVKAAVDFMVESAK